ncbi:MAG: helix-turn-helix domain-containing protein [Nocardioidaceae bacterium]|mgnify:CR=1 FL=1
MTGQVKRRYDATRRREAAEQTRLRILEVAGELFGARGYAATAVGDIASRAGVSVDTLYATVGRKPQLLLAVHDMALAGGRPGVAAVDRDYVRRVREAPGAAAKIAAYADAMGELLPRTVPLLLALRDAGRQEPDCQAVLDQVRERRAGNMRLFAADLRATGELREDLDDETVADLVWSMNDPDYFALVTSRGRSARDYAELVRDVWTRTLLATPPHAADGPV